MHKGLNIHFFLYIILLLFISSLTLPNKIFSQAPIPSQVCLGNCPIDIPTPTIFNITISPTQAYISSTPISSTPTLPPPCEVQNTNNASRTVTTKRNIINNFWDFIKFIIDFIIKLIEIILRLPPGSVIKPGNPPVEPTLTPTPSHYLPQPTNSPSSSPLPPCPSATANPTITIPPQPTSTTPAVSSPPVNPGTVPAGYKLVFSDEFNAQSFNLNRWLDYNVFNVDRYTTTDEDEHYTHGDNLIMRDGSLVIQGRNNNGASCDYEASNCTSGYISSKAHFVRGYFESRAKTNITQGSWPAFWLYGVENIAPLEWDIFEIVSDPNTVYQTPHFRGEDQSSCGNPTQPLANAWDWHVYGFLWTDDEVIWTVDGKEYNKCTITLGGDRNANWMRLEFNLAIGGTWAGRTDGSTQWPMEYVIDYARVYQDNNGSLNLNSVSQAVDPVSPQ